MYFKGRAQSNGVCLKMNIFTLPDLGEGLADAEIVAWHVTEGSDVMLDQNLVSVETAKAVVDVPSPISGRIRKLHGKPGDVVKTGAVLVEYEAIADTGTVAGKLETSDKVMTEPSIALTNQTGNVVKVSPAVRALAQRLKVDLTKLLPSGANNTITLQDVQQASSSDHTPLTRVRRAMAQNLSQASKDVVMITVVDDARLLNWTETTDVSVRLVQALVKACLDEPALNAWYDGISVSRRLMPEVHVGLAMDSEDGLFVPVIRDAHTLNAEQLRKTIEKLKQSVHDRSILPADLQGATIILSNFGKFAGRYATPIVIPPMVAIVAAGSLRQEVLAIQNTPTICSVLPLSLSVDHRAVTGGEATRFLGTMMKTLSE